MSDIESDIWLLMLNGYENLIFEIDDKNILVLG